MIFYKQFSSPFEAFLRLCIMYFCLVLWDSVASPNKWPGGGLDVLLNLMFIPLLPVFSR